MFRPSVLLARWIVRRPALVAVVGLALAVASVWIIMSENAFDSDILNLLPAQNPAVRGLKVYNSEFTQNRELAFMLVWDRPPADSEHYQQTFTAMLAKEPWVLRMLDQPPLESSGGRDSINDIIVPLLLNLPPEKFDEALKGLAPEEIKARISRLAQQTAAGSPKARFELETDPLGLVARATEPVAKTVSISDAFMLVSPDGEAILVPVISNQPDTSADACHETMRKVRNFIGRAEKELGADGPRILVTGRSAYVDEISASMARDITLTSVVSLLCVTALFWIGFRQLMPLIGIAIILALTALVTMAGGATIFSKLNVLAISFCSILFGLGDDFSLLLCQRFFRSRNEGMPREEAIAESIRHSMPGILWVALTTGIGFLTLCFSGSQGFGQMGVLVALGVLLCALFMPVFLFLFVHKSPPHAAETGPARSFAWRCLHAPGSVLRPASLVFGLAVLLSVLPWRSLSFDISPTSLEPRDTPAAKTLALMMEKFPATFEPVMVVMEKPERTQLAALDKVLAQLKDEKLIESSSSPSALALNAGDTAINKTALKAWDAEPAVAALEAGAEASDLNAEVFQKTTQTLRKLKEQPDAFQNWQDFLPTKSLWWFLLDRMVAPESGAAIAYIKLPKETTLEQRQQITAELSKAVPEASVTGWSQALVSLIPWAQRELAVFGGAVTMIILLILAFVYRDARLWILHVVSLLAAAAGTVATLKLLHAPINLLNVLAFPLMLAVGVDYGTHIILAAREPGNILDNLAGVIKPIALSGLTTATGFGSLMLAQNPSLAGLGAICSIGVLWCLLATLFIVVPCSAVFLKSASPSEKKSH